MPDFLYIHIPFCVRKCIYCDFLSVTYDESLARRYVTALCSELRMKKDSVIRLKTVFIGGGTPSVLPEGSFREIFSCLQNNFNLSEEAEITVEANPGTIDSSKIETLLGLGVNRLSIGVQSFNDEELKTLGRIHTAEEAVQAAQIAKSAGLHNLSIDIMYGIPGQTAQSWSDTMEKAVGLAPEHISAYELTPEDHTPLFSRIRSGILKMPEEDFILEMYGNAIHFFTAKGFMHYEISNYALPGFKCLHNMNYWDRGEYVAAGAGAHSFVNGVRARNTNDIKKYIEGIGFGVVPEVESETVTLDDAIREFIFLGLRKTEGISIEKTEEYGLDIAGKGMSLFDAGYLSVYDEKIRLTGKGLPVSNMIIVRLFELLGL